MSAQAYAEADGIASEALFSMRTVASLGIEAHFRSLYHTRLAKAARVGIMTSPFVGFFAGVAASSFLLLLGVGFMAGGFFLAQEMDESSFNYAPTFGSTRYNYCAFTNNTPAPNFTTGSEPCPEPLLPWKMNCILMGFVGTLLHRVHL